MPNRNYINGRQHEYRVLREAKARGCIALRSAGSHSPVDVVIIDTFNRKITLVQCKPASMPDRQMREIEEQYKELNGSFEVVYEVR